MERYSSNSHKSKNELQQDKKVEKVVTGSVKTKKKNEIRKLTDVFVSEDVSSVKSYIFFDVVVPAIKRIISDTVETVLYGESGRSKKSSSGSRVSYGRYYDREDDRRNSRLTVNNRIGYDYNDIVLTTRGEAEAVLSQLDELLDIYGVVSVGDLYDSVGIVGNYTDQKYGWSNLSTAKAVPVRDGYLLKLPKALPLD